MHFVFPIEQLPRNRRWGNKARGLRQIIQLGLPAPQTWLIPADVKEKFREDKNQAREILLSELQGLAPEKKHFAVRSSGELEDSENFSFAGQYTTVLNVRGTDALLEAIQKVWESADAVSDRSYMHQIVATDAPAAAAGMGVILQEMVKVQWAGVAFSINPVTGRFESVIEGVQGCGEKLVQEGLNPERWIWHQGTWEPEVHDQGPPRHVLQSLVEDLQKLRKELSSEVDVEWAWDGSTLYYLQCRQVTAGKFPTIYSNHISREFLPGMIKPLVWSINIPVVNSAWLRLLKGLLGNLDIEPEQLSHAFYYRAYFNMGTLGELFRMMGLPRDSLESLMGRKDPSGKSSFRPGWKTLRYLPSMVAFLLSNLNLGRKFRKRLTKLDRLTEEIQEEIALMTPETYPSLFKRLHALSRESAYWNIVIPLSMQISNRLLQRKMEKKGLDFHKIDFTTEIAELRQYDPQYQLGLLRNAWEAIPEEQRKQTSTYSELQAINKKHPLEGIRKELEQFINRFGHFSESGNDFSREPWRENPEFVFDMLRQPSPGDKKPAGESSAEKHIGLKGTYRRAARYRLYREMISSSYTRTYGLFRSLFLETGKVLCEKGSLKDAEDVFYLSLEEHDRLLEDPTGSEAGSLKEKISRVKDEMEEYRDIALPPVIYGEIPPPVVPPEASLLKGIPVSPGIFEGEVVVVKSYKEFHKKVEGKILVIPYSDIGWTSILSHAGAIVSESGGMLSHASILARELSLPAISSVDHACALKDGVRARVDANHGIMIIDKSNN